MMFKFQSPVEASERLVRNMCKVVLSLRMCTEVKLEVVNTEPEDAPKFWTSREACPLTGI